MSTSTMLPSLWETVKCDFKGLFPEDVFHMWFEPMVCLESTEEQMTLGVPNDFAAIWIHDNYLDLITQRLRLTSGRMITVTLKKTDSAAAPQQETEPRAGMQEAAGNARVRAHQRRSARTEGHSIAS
ncbi:MAG TPA: DnaA N-terminal domain-containing protein, partial [Opitutaceae bacterium]|nr:DnaA N-terminal domain-containing protein [Opitutaceae bacterium]